MIRLIPNWLVRFWRWETGADQRDNVKAAAAEFVHHVYAKVLAQAVKESTAANEFNQDFVYQKFMRVLCELYSMGHAVLDRRRLDPYKAITEAMKVAHSVDVLVGIHIIDVSVRPRVPAWT